MLTRFEKQSSTTTRLLDIWPFVLRPNNKEVFMNPRTLVLPTVVGVALMACGGAEMTTSIRSFTPDSTIPVTLPSVEITPRAATVVRGAQVSLYLTLKGFNGEVSDRSGIWTSSNSSVVQVSRLDANGASSSSIPYAIAYAAGVGSATITVWVAGRSASVAVTVTEATTTNP